MAVGFVLSNIIGSIGYIALLRRAYNYAELFFILLWVFLNILLAREYAAGLERE